jgi:hypothetical protein
MMSKLIGRRNTTAIEESDLSSAFNEWMDGKLLVVVNELMTLDRQQTMNRLKSYITDPYLRINRKGVQTYDYENRAHFMLFSNHEDAAKIETGDRRYFVWISKAKKREDSYYTDLMHWFEEEGGAEAVLHFLQQRDISEFNPNAPAPLTESKQRVIEQSRTALEAYLQEAFNAADAPFQCDLVAINDAIDCLRKEKNMTVSHTVLSKFLRKVEAKVLGQISLDDGRRPMIWALRDVELWNNIPAQNAALLVRQYYRRPGVQPPLTDEEKAAMKPALRLNSLPK